MHIPPFYKRKSWQYLFIGALFGGIISYFVIIFMYGKMYETLVEKNIELEVKLSELEARNEALLEDNKDLDEKSNEKITVESIDVEFINARELRLDRLITHQFEEMVTEEINHIVGQDLEVVSASDELLISTIENKAFTIDDFTYYFEVVKLTISKKITISLKAKISN